MKLRAFTGCFIACWLSIAACDSAPPPASDGKGIHGGAAAAGGSAVPGTPNGTGGVLGATSGNAAPSGAGAGGGVVGGSSAGGAAMGGSSSSGNGGAGSGTGATGGSAAPSNPLDKGNYFQSGAWMGYVWTSANGAGSTITPKDFATQPTGMPRCVKGSVAATMDFSGTAILGVNLSEGSGVTSMTVTPSKEGVMLDITNTAKSPLRFQIKSSTTGGTEWCTPIMGSGFIPWSSLRTKCWDTTGAQYKREPIAAAMILVPGTNTAAVAFDFCLNGLVEADMPAGGSAGSGGTGTAGMSGSGGMSGMSGNGGMSGSTSGGMGGTSVPPLQNGCAGFATRFWDCCKPHCGWSSNAPTGPLASCDSSDNSLGGNYDAANSCQGGNAFLCHSNAPWAVSDQLSYGYTAVAARSGSDICGKCYQLQFTGNSHNGGGDPGSALLAGKTMIVQAINIGGDVGSGQFDIAIPGGGVGAFNACSSQWGVSASQLGPNYGGFLAACKQQGISDHAGLKSCVMQKCTSVFSDKGLTELFDGCKWFVDWFQAADNPSLEYAEVPCPSDLQNRGLRRSGGGGGSCLR